MNTQLCPHCGKELPSNFTFCSHCGQKLEDIASFEKSNPTDTISAKKGHKAKTKKAPLALIAIIAVLLIAILAGKLFTDTAASVDADPFEGLYVGQTRSNILAYYGSPDESSDSVDVVSDIHHHDRYYDLPEFGTGTELYITYENEIVGYTSFSYVSDDSSSNRKCAQKWYDYYCQKYGPPYEGESFGVDSLIWETGSGKIYVDAFYIDALENNVEFYDFFMTWEP